MPPRYCDTNNYLRKKQQVNKSRGLYLRPVLLTTNIVTGILFSHLFSLEHYHLWGICNIYFEQVGVEKRLWFLRGVSPFQAEVSKTTNVLHVWCGQKRRRSRSCRFGMDAHLKSWSSLCGQMESRAQLYDQVLHLPHTTLASLSVLLLAATFFPFFSPIFLTFLLFRKQEFYRVIRDMYEVRSGTNSRQMHRQFMVSFLTKILHAWQWHMTKTSWIEGFFVFVFEAITMSSPLPSRTLCCQKLAVKKI